MLFLDGVYVPARGGVCFRRAKPPSAAALDMLIYRISERVGRYLERAGLLVRDMDNSYLTLESRDEESQLPYQQVLRLRWATRRPWTT